MLRSHIQFMTVAARAIAEKNIFGHLSCRFARRRQSFCLPNKISILLRRLYRHLSYLTVALLCVRPRILAAVPLSFNISLNHSASSEQRRPYRSTASFARRASCAGRIRSALPADATYCDLIKYPAQYTPVIDAELAMGLQEKGLGTRHLCFGQPEVIRHVSQHVFETKKM